MHLSAPADGPADRHDAHRSREAVDRGALIVALAIAAIAGIVSAQSLDSLAIGLVIGSTVFAGLAPLFAAATR